MNTKSRTDSLGGCPLLNSAGWRHSGFSLMEVLVAVAIVGISLGTLLAIFSQGHRSSFRARQAAEAADAAGYLLHQWRKEGFPQEAQGEIEGHTGWSYSIMVPDRPPLVEIEPAAAGFSPRSLGVAAEGEERVVVEPEELREARLTIKPPDGRVFVLRFLILRSELEQ